MSIENAIIARIAALGTNAGSRVYREVIVQEPELPAVAVSRLAGSGAAHDLSNAPLLFRATLRVETIAESMAAVSPVASAVAAGLDGWRGTVSGVAVLRCRLTQQQEQAEAEGDRTFRVIQQDYELLYR